MVHHLKLYYQILKGIKTCSYYFLYKTKFLILYDITKETNSNLCNKGGKVNVCCTESMYDSQPEAEGDESLEGNKIT